MLTQDRKHNRRLSLSEEDAKAALDMYLSGEYAIKDILNRFGIYNYDLQRIAREAGYGY